MNKPVLCCLALLLAAVAHTQAAFTITVAQVGPNVVLTGSGTINLAALTFTRNGGILVGINPSFGVVDLGVPAPNSQNNSDIYNATLSGPSNFGLGENFVFADSGTGDLVGLYQEGEIRVPAGYVSGRLLADTATFNNATFSSLGFTPGTYVYTFGSGASADTFTITGSLPVVPEPSTWATLGVGAVGAGFVMSRRRACR